MKKTKIVIVPIIISLLLVTMSMLLSGCSFLDIYFRTAAAGKSVFGIPTGVYDLIDEDKENVDTVFHWLNISNNIEFVENHLDNYSYDIYQDKDGKIYMGQKGEPVEYKRQIVYLYEDKTLVIHWYGKILHYKKDKPQILENYGIPKGTYNLVEEDLLANNEISTELIVDGGVEFGGVKYDFSQDEDGKINILNSETTDGKKQIIYFYEDNILEVRWNEDLIFHFKQNETK